MRWLVVCTGNTCRSPALAAMLRLRFEHIAPGQHEVRSRASNGELVHPQRVNRCALRAVEVGLEIVDAGGPPARVPGGSPQLREILDSLREHRSRVVDRDDIEWADRIVPVDQKQVDRLQAAFGPLSTLTKSVDVRDEAFDIWETLGYPSDPSTAEFETALRAYDRLMRDLASAALRIAGEVDSTSA